MWGGQSAGRCDTPGVSFVLRREICPNLGCSVKISISRPCLSLISQTIRTHITEFGVIQSHKRPNSEPAKTFISRNECRLENHSRIINLIWSSLNQTLDGCYLVWARVWFLEHWSMSDYFNLSPYSQTEYSVYRPLINSYSTQPSIFVSKPNSKPTPVAILKYHDSPSPTKNPKPIKSQDDLFSNHA